MFRCRAYPFALVAVLALGASACSGGEEGAATTSPRAAAPVAEQTAPPAPVALIAIRDGDTSKPVRKATVKVGGEIMKLGPQGVVRLAPRPRSRVKVSARGYGTRVVDVNFRRQLAQRIDLWRPAAQWPVYGANPARTQAHSGIKIRPPFRVLWRKEMGSLLEFPAVVWNGVAYVNNLYGHVRALSMRNGHVLWRARVGRRMASSPGLDPKHGLLVTTSMTPGSVKVLSMKSGHVRWTVSTGRAEPSPVIRKGVAYLGAANGNVYALELKHKRVKWVFQGGAKITGSPALQGRRLFVGDYAGRVFALDSRTGRRLWTGSSGGGRVYGTTAVAGGRVFAPSVTSGLTAFSARTGRVLWRIPVGAYLYSSPGVYRGRVYFGAYTGYVYCASARSGRILWARPAGGAVSGAVEIVDGLVYAASFGSRITAWNWRTGNRVWSFSSGRYVPVSGSAAGLLIHGSRTIWAVTGRKPH
jgi:outer membrane protein assembly factor BamB